MHPWDTAYVLELPRLGEMDDGPVYETIAENTGRNVDIQAQPLPSVPKRLSEVTNSTHHSPSQSLLQIPSQTIVNTTGQS